MTDSRQSLYHSDEDYTGSVCLLLPDGHATLIDIQSFDWAVKFEWQVMGRMVFRNERTPVTYERRRCGVGRRGFGYWRQGGTQKTIILGHEIFKHGITGTKLRDLLRKLNGNHLDHKNRNPWDMRRKNLRIATPSQNAQNKGPARLTTKSSKYKGVSRLKHRWVAQIKVEGKHYNLGVHDTERQAAAAYNDAVRRLCPEFGYLNPLDDE